jgi:hypothetical protein
MKISRILFGVATVGVAVLSLVGCKAPPAPKNVVIPEEQAKLMKTAERIPFHKAWGKPDLIRKYDKIEIAVKISHKQLQSSWWGEQNVRNLVASQKEDMKDLANFTVKAFKEAFKKSKHLKLVDKAGPETLALEFAIVQVIPNKPVLGAVSNITSLTPIGLLLLPVKMGGKGVSSESGGVVAMETIIRDSQTGKILGVAADRAKGKVALFNAKEFTAYAAIRAIVDTWAKNIVTALDQIKEGEKVNIQKPDTFTPIDY